MIIIPDTGPKGISANLGPQHVQRPAAFLINDLVQNLLHVRQIVVYDRDPGQPFLQIEDGLPAALQAGNKCVPALVMFGAKQSEVGGETFAEPNIIPVFLCDCISKPLMRDFMRNKVSCRLILN